MPDLFSEKPELTRQQKIKKSRKLTTDFTKEAIEYLNNTGCFKVWRNNNIPSTRLYREKEWVTGITEDGNEIRVEVEIPKVAFKSNQTKVSTFDIIGFRIMDGLHLEIEVKTNKDKLSQEQETHLKDLKAAGSISFIISDMITLRHQITPFLERKLAF